MTLSRLRISPQLLTMFAGAFCVSAGSAFIKLAGDRLPVMEVVFARSFFMLLYCYFLVRKAGAGIVGNDKPILFIRGILGFGAYAFISYSVIHMPLADALVVIYSFPLIVPFMAAIFLRERLEGRVFFCSLLGAIGMFFIAKPDMVFHGTSTIPLLAVSAAIGASLCSSVSVVCIRKLTATEHPLVIVFYAAAISTLGSVLLDGWNWLVPTWQEVLILLCVGIFTSLGQHFITVAFSKSSAGRTSIMFYFQVLAGAILGYLFFNEIPDWATFVGAAFILGGATLLGFKKSTGPAAEKSRS